MQESALPKVSVITPTYQRKAYLRRRYDVFKAQTYPNKEWVILDDSPLPDPFFKSLKDPEVRYIFQPKKLPIGAKIRCLIEAACGEIMVHFDDDDEYAPNYCERMVYELSQAEFIKLSAWFIYSVPHDLWGYCSLKLADTMKETVFCLSGAEPIRVLHNFEYDESMKWGYGFTYAYWKKAVERFPIPIGNNSWDFQWVLDQLIPAGVRVKQLEDREGLVLRMHHGHNVSETFFQYRLPLFAVPQLQERIATY